MDVLVHTSVEGQSDTPPASPSDGDAWLIGASAQGVWAGFADHLALYQSNSWNFVEPKPGMRIFDKDLGQFWLFDTHWATASAPDQPAGGVNADAEARAAIGELLQVLRTAGILPRS